MNSPDQRPADSPKSSRFERVYRPIIFGTGMACLCLVLMLQVIGVLSRNSSGLMMLGVAAVMWLTTVIVERLVDDR